MNLMDVLLQANQGQSINSLSQQFGLDTKQTQNILGQLLPVLAAGLQKNTAQQGGLESLLGALANGGHQKYLDNPALLGAAATVADGNGILGHILGSKDVSRSVAAQVSAKTGVSDDLIKKMLPVVATLAMGALAKQSAGGKQQQGLLSLLDRNNDGSIIDDVAGMIGNFFRK
jgi:hypothetical protein